jgi:hypothetical protein
VAFFESADTPAPRFDPERMPLPWEDGLGQTVFTDVILAKGSDGLLMLRNLIAFPKVMTLSVVALFRNPLVQGPGTRGQTARRLTIFGMNPSGPGSCYSDCASTTDPLTEISTSGAALGILGDCKREVGASRVIEIFGHLCRRRAIWNSGRPGPQPRYRNTAPCWMAL